MISIRPEKPEDYAAIAEITTLAFGQPNEARLVEALRAADDFEPALSLVAEEDGEIIGHILFSTVTLESPAGGMPILCLAPMSVHPDHQNKGVGTALVKAGFEQCRLLGHKIIVVIGHPNYYPRFGFTPARAAPAKRLDVEFPVPDEAFMVLELVPDALAGYGGMVKFPKAFEEAM